MTTKRTEGMPEDVGGAGEVEILIIPRGELSVRDCDLIGELEGQAAELMATIRRFGRPGRETSLAITKLQEAILWAGQAIESRNTGGPFSGV